MAINTGKVIAGGLLTGLVLNLFDITENMTVFAAENEAMLKRLNLNPAIATDFSYAIPWIVVDFVMGLVVVFTYAGLRPRFGAGSEDSHHRGIRPVARRHVRALRIHVDGRVHPIDDDQGLAAFPRNVAIASVVGAWVYKE